MCSFLRFSGYSRFSLSLKNLTLRHLVAKLKSNVFKQKTALIVCHSYISRFQQVKYWTPWTGNTRSNCRVHYGPWSTGLSTDRPDRSIFFLMISNLAFSFTLCSFLFFYRPNMVHNMVYHDIGHQNMTFIGHVTFIT